MVYEVTQPIIDILKATAKVNVNDAYDILYSILWADIDTDTYVHDAFQTGLAAATIDKLCSISYNEFDQNQGYGFALVEGSEREVLEKIAKVIKQEFSEQDQKAIVVNLVNIAKLDSLGVIGHAFRINDLEET
jgi:hypothetical protein